LFGHTIHTYEYFILYSIMFSPHNTHIAFPNFSLVFWLPMQYLCCVFEFFISFLANYAIPTYGSWNVHHCINQLFNICILACFPTSKFDYMWILHVSCSTCGFGIILMWVLHFKVKGLPKVSLDQQMFISTWPLCRFCILGN
jgi:hypothetical protein